MTCKLFPEAAEDSSTGFNQEDARPGNDSGKILQPVPFALVIIWARDRKVNTLFLEID